MQKYLILFNTLKYMKSKQILYRIYYVLRNKFRKATKFSYNYSIPSISTELKLDKSIASYKSVSNDSFNFLNLSLEFKDKIDWNTLKHGKLWVYNLNYFEFLNQDGMNKDDGLSLINDYIENINTSTEGLEPFPISLRSLNWIKFLTTHKVKNQKIDDCLYSQCQILIDNLEYHLLGNHLLENGFSLLFGAYYFEDIKFYKKAKQILIAELDEQILSDGSHFELTPMYHQLMMFRVLDCLNLVLNNSIFDKELQCFLRDKAKVMCSWLKEISYKDGGIAHFNDSTDGVAPTSNMLFEYCDRLDIIVDKLPLGDCGYRSFEGNDFELKVDVGEIGPSYIPGHAHSDTFNFELRVNEKPFIVDTGISTYESNARRLDERKTSSHNTVMIDDIDQSQVWSSFRVGNRAHIIDFNAGNDFVEAVHDGYENIGIKHKREFKISDTCIDINDFIIGDLYNNYEKTAFIHFHPDILDMELKDAKLTIKNIILTIKGSKKMQLDDYMFAYGFNKLKYAKVLKITFKDKLFVNISFI